jgi:hypothetical protein
MRISKENAPYLFNEYEWSKAICKRQIPVQEYVMKFCKSMKNINSFGLVQGYCSSIGLEKATEEEKTRSFLKFLNRVFTLIYCNFKVEVVEESFYDNIQYCSMEKILENQKLYDLLGECSGVMLFPDVGLVEYAILKEGVFLRFMEDGKEDGRISFLFSDYDYDDIAQGEEHRLFFLATLNVLLMKKFGEVETIVVAKDAIRTIGDKKVANKMPFPIRHLDSSYFKTIIRTEGFMVQGFWRNQACGKGWKEHKLIFIKAFQKHGYVRRAPALINRAVS